MSGRDVIDLNKFKKYIEVNDNLQDDFLQTLLDEAFNFAEQYVDRPLAYGQHTEDFYIDSDNFAIEGRYYVVQLLHTPVDLSKDINLYFDGTLDNDKFVRVTSNGELFITTLPSDKLTVEYYGGYNAKGATEGVPIPDALEYAIIVLASVMFNESKGTLGLKAVKVGGEDVQILEDDIPRRARRILDSYKRVGL